MKLALKIIIPLLMIAGGVFAFKMLKASAPPPPSKTPPVVIPAANYVESTADSYSPPVRTFGTVSSNFETTLNAQVSGRIIEVSPEFQVGTKVKKNDVLVRIDATDFEAALVNQQSNLTLAKRTLAEEEIRSKQAAEDWEISGRDLKKAPAYVLREPQLAAAEGDVKAAESAITKAEADLERTVILAPFDGLVTARSASLGNLANPQATLGTLIATERVEVFLPLTPDQVRRVQLPSPGQPGPECTLTSALYPDAHWNGKITRIAPTISRDQVVTVIAEVENPFDQNPPLTIGSFVNAEITAKPIEKTHRIPEAALVNDAFVWAIDPENKLVRLEADRIHSDLGFAFVKLTNSKLNPPLRIVSRPLTNFDTGTLVKPIEPDSK